MLYVTLCYVIGHGVDFPQRSKSGFTVKVRFGGADQKCHLVLSAAAQEALMHIILTMTTQLFENAV